MPVSENEYIVESGDTLLAISKRFGVELAQLMNLNAIADARKLRVGQRLQIPASTIPVPMPIPSPLPAQPPPPAADPAPQPARGAIYVVRSGDTLGAIATQFNVTVAAIVAANKLVDANRIRAGQPLTIPRPLMVLRVAEEMAMATASRARSTVLGVGDPETPLVTPREIEDFLAGKRTTFYITRKGDTIPRVAGLFHMDALVLSQINEVGLQGELIPGTRLIIPMK